MNNLENNQEKNIYCSHYQDLVDNISKCGLHRNTFESGDCESCGCAEEREVE